MYTEACDEWINAHIFETRTNQETSKAEMLVKSALQLGTAESETARLFESFKKADIGLTQLETRLIGLANRALDNRMLGRFEQLYLKNGEETQRQSIV